MEEFSREKAETLAEALRRIALKLEKGYPISEQQEKLILRLAKEILFTNQSPKKGYKFTSVDPIHLEEENEGKEPE